MNKSEVVGNFISVVEGYPLVVFHAAMFMVSPSQLSFWSIVVGALANMFFNWLIMELKLIAFLRETIHDLGDKLEGRTCTHYSLADFIDILSPEKRKELSELTEQRLMSTILGKIRLIVISGGLERLTCHCQPPLGGYILLSDPPKETTGLRRFFVLHEISHWITRLMTQDFRSLLGMKLNFFFICWILLNIELTANSLFLLIAVTIGLQLRQNELRKESELDVLKNEIIADTFALTFLEDAELNSLFNRKEKLRLLLDKTMSPTFNSARLAQLEQNISDVIRHKTASFLPQRAVENFYKLTPTSGLIAAALFALPAALSNNSKNSDMLILAFSLFLIFLFAKAARLLIGVFVDHKIFKTHQTVLTQRSPTATDFQ